MATSICFLWLWNVSTAIVLSCAGLLGSVYYQIFMSLKGTVLRSNLYAIYGMSICLKGIRSVTSEDIILPPLWKLLMIHCL